MATESGHVKLPSEFTLLDDFNVPSYEDWRKQVDIDLKGAPFEKKLITQTEEGINLQPLYLESDLPAAALIDQFPGTTTKIRGNAASGYLGRPWQVTQEINLADPVIANQKTFSGLNRGQTAVYFTLHPILQAGLPAGLTPENYDRGVYIPSSKAMTALFKNIDLTTVPVHFYAGWTGQPLLSLLSNYMNIRELNWADYSGSLTADPIGYLAVTGHLPVSFESAMDMLSAFSLDMISRNQSIKSILVDTSHYRNAGAHAVQELAYALATLTEYFHGLTDRDMTVSQAAGSVMLAMGTGPNVFMEIAKYRAIRMLWSQLLDAFGLPLQDQPDCFVHARPATFWHTLHDPYVNMLRVTTQSFSAILGGVDSLHASPFDEAIRTPDRFSRRIARNTQTILNEEAHLGHVIDPAGGSYYIEYLTQKLAEQAWSHFQSIETDGGMVASLSSGRVQGDVAAVVESTRQDATKRKRVQVGTNMVVDVKEKKLDTRPPVTGPEMYQLEQKYAEDRPELEISTDLDDIALNGGSICQLMKAILPDDSNPETVEPLKMERLSVPFEQLRARVSKMKPSPKIFLVPLGSPKENKARADFSRGFFETGGLSVLYPNPFADIQSAVDAVKAEHPHVVVLCSTDENYVENVEPFVTQMKAAIPHVICVLAGYPKDKVDDYKAAGMDDFIFLGADVLTFLNHLLDQIELAQ